MLEDFRLLEKAAAPTKNEKISRADGVVEWQLLALWGLLEKSCMWCCKATETPITSNQFTPISFFLEILNYFILIIFIEYIFKNGHLRQLNGLKTLNPK